MRVPAAMVLAGSLRRVPHDSIVVRQGEPSSFLYVVERGAVRLSSVTPDGRELIVTILAAGGVFGESSLFGLPSPVDARTIGRTILVGFDAAMLPRLVRDEPRAGAELFRLLAARQHATERQLRHTLSSDVSGRITERLRELADAHGRPVPGGTRIAIPLTQDELARLVGATREAVNRALRALRTRGDVRLADRAFVVPDGGARTAAS